MLRYRFARSLLLQLVLTAPLWADKFALDGQLEPTEDGLAVGQRSSACGGSVARGGELLVIGCPNYTISHFEEGAAFVYRKVAGEWQYVARLLPSVRQQGRHFGAAVAIDDDQVIVGSPRVQGGGVFVFSTADGFWAEIQQLGSGSDLAGEFGYSLATAPGRLIVGAPRLDNTPGHAYLYRRVGQAWLAEATLESPSRRFGAAVTLRDNWAAVSQVSTTNTPPFYFRGTVVLFELTDSWTERQRIAPSDSQETDGFGASVYLDAGGLLAAGAPGSDNHGAAYLFRKGPSEWVEEYKASAPDSSPLDQFGRAVLVSGDRLLIGAGLDDDSGTDSGSLYSFRRLAGSWGFEAKRLDPLTLARSEFGSSLALDGSAIWVGSPKGMFGAGAASGAVQELPLDAAATPGTRLSGADSAARDGFGGSLSRSEDWAFVGAPSDSLNAGDQAGAVYVFRRTGGGWQLTQKLHPQDGQRVARFGAAVSIAGSWALIGAPGQDTAGAVYVYQLINGSWTQQSKLTPPVSTNRDRFGQSVALSGTTALVGSPDRAHQSQTFVGAVFVFERDGVQWTQQQLLLRPEPLEWDQFGFALAVSGDYLLAGTPGRMVTGVQSAEVVAFQRFAGTWAPMQVLRPMDTSSTFLFGWAIALQGTSAVIGLGNGGMAYVFEHDGSSWSERQRLVAGDPANSNNHFGRSLSLDGDLIVVSADADPYQDNPYRGVVYTFRRLGERWYRFSEASVPAPQPKTAFGGSVALIGETLLASAAGDESNLPGAPASGVVYSFHLTATPPGSFYTLAPCRIADTRAIGQGPALVNGVSRAVGVVDTCQIPPTAKSLAVNVTITGADGAGHLVLHAANAPVPSTSSISFAMGQTRANNAIVAIGSDGVADLRIQPTVTAGGTVHVILDVVGYFD